MIEINMLPVHEGDCFHIHFMSEGAWHNIVIDSGPSASAAQFRTLMDQIRNRQEYVDLLCFSHIDDDHIKGAEMTFAEPSFDSTHIKQIWINLPDSITSSNTVTTLPPQQNITAESAYKIYSYITSRNIPCITEITAGIEMKIDNITVIAILPNKVRLAAYYRKFEKDFERLQQTKPYLFIGGEQSDSSPYNGSSISLILSTFAGRMLFTGDAFAPDLVNAVQHTTGDDGFILAKLPHHGSDRNINKELLDTLSCKHFLCSTHSTAYRPAQGTINLLADYGKTHDTVSLYSNYPWPFIQAPEHGLKIIELSDSKSPVRIGKVAIFTEV